MNFIGTGILVPLLGLVLFAPRRWALLAMLGGALYLPQQQVIELLGLNLTAVRLLELAGFTRDRGVQGVKALRA